MARAELEGMVLMRRAADAATRTAEVAERTRHAIGRAQTLLHETALRPPHDPREHRRMTSSLRAFSELERADHSLARLRKEVTTTWRLLADVTGQGSSLIGERAAEPSGGMAAGAGGFHDARDALRATVRAVALAEETWVLAHDTAALVVGASRSMPEAGLARRMQATAAVSVARAALRDADALTAGAGAAGRHLASATGSAGDLATMLAAERLVPGAGAASPGRSTA